MRGDAFLNADLPEDVLQHALNGTARHGECGMRHMDAAAPRSGKQKRGIAVSDPEVAEDGESSVRQGNVAVFGALAVMDVNEHPGAVDIFDAEADALPQVEAEGIDGGQGGAVAEDADVGEKCAHFLLTEDIGKFLFFARDDEIQKGHFLMACVFEEELDGGESLFEEALRILHDVLHMEEVGSELLLAEEMG